MVLILVILWMAGVLVPMLLFIGSILKGLATSFLDLLRGMLCPCGPKCDPDDWVRAEVAEGYRDTIANLQKENLDLQRQLDWAKTQQKQVPDPPFDNTAQTPEAATTSMSSAMLVAINVATTVVTGLGWFLASWAMGENPELGPATGMSPSAMAVQAAQARRA